MSSSESTNLTQDVEPARSGSYFSSPELSQRADLLRHLTENSNLIPLIRGVEGMGKTTFIQNLLDLAPENWIPVEIYADVMLQPDSLLANLAGLFDQNERSDRLIDDLILHFEDLRHDGFLPVIVVDDAHLLPEASIITLLRLHERGTDEAPLAQILLFAEPEIDELLKTPQLRVMNLQSLQLLDMPEFTLDQTALFLEHLLSSEESSSIKAPTASQIENIHSQTGGSPGLIKQHAQKLIDSASKSSLKSNMRSNFSKRSIIGAGSALFVAALILIYQDDINAIFSGENEAVDTAPKEQSELKGYKPLVLPDSEKVSEPEPEMAEAEPVNQDVPGDMEIVEGKEADLGPVTEEDIKEKSEQKDVAPKKEVVQPKVAQVQPEPKAEISQPPKEATQPKKEEKPVSEPVEPPQKKAVPKPLPAEKEVGQKVTPTVKPAPKPKKKQEVVQKQPEAVKESKPEKQLETISVQPVEVKRKVEAPPVKPTVKVQPKPEVNVAEKPVEAAPQVSVQKKIPVPAPVEEKSTMLSKQEEVPAVKVAEPSSKQAKKQPTVTAPKPASKTPIKASIRFLREDWLLKQKPTSYTIQLVGLQDEKGIAGFIKKHSVDGPIAYYRTERKGKPWFPVLYGAYSTRSRAVAARDNLPKSLMNSGVWLRTLSSVQKDIRAR